MTDPASEAVLAVNARFYAAFAEHDGDAMEQLWARAPAISCVHPGWPPIRGRAEVIGSWRAIFEHDEGPAPSCEGPTVVVHGDAATVLCRERIDGVVLVATNVYVHEDDGWRLAHHHASALARVPATPPMDPELLPN